MSSSTLRRPLPPLDAEGRALVERYRPLADRWARDAAARFPNRAEDDFRSACYFGLVKAAARYEPGLNGPTAWFEFYLRDAVGRVLRDGLPRGFRRRVARGAVPETAPLGALETVWGSDPAAAVDAADAVEWALGRLPGRQRDVVRLVDLDGLTQAEAAERLGLSRSQVQLARSQAHDAIRKRLNL